MMKKGKYPKHQKMVMLPLSVLMIALLACSFNSATPTANGPLAATATPASAIPTASGPVVPEDWKVTTDASGSCRVSTPPDWQPGVDFLLESGKSFPAPFEGMPGYFPPRGTALWPADATPQPPQGWRFQLRTSIVNGEHFCSVFRIKPGTDFTDPESSLMKQVGSTLQEAQTGFLPLFGVAFLAASRLPQAGRLQPGGLPNWDTYGQSYNGQNSDGSSESSNSSDQNSSDGQTFHDRTSRRGNEDGSSDEEENTTGSNGTNFKGNSKTTTKTDPRGNRTVHHEQIIKENGKCTKLTVDTMYNKNNEVVGTPKRTKVDIPCPVYTLKIDFSGNATFDGLNAKYGPNSEWVWLEYESGTHTGQFSGNWDIAVTGECEGFGQFPVTFDIRATEDSFQALTFNIRASLGYRLPSLCPKGIGASMPPQTKTLNFALPGEVGASAVMGEEVKITFTLLRGGE